MDFTLKLYYIILYYIIHLYYIILYYIILYYIILYYIILYYDFYIVFRNVDSISMHFVNHTSFQRNQYRYKCQQSNKVLQYYVQLFLNLYDVFKTQTYQTVF